MKLRRGLPPCPPVCDFCPLCCKGGAANLDGSSSFDPLQRFWVGRGNGLCVLDLSRAGETCEDRRFCQLTCLVCGGPVVHGEDGSDFELFRDVVNGDAAGDGRRMHSILQRRQATMVENWDTPVHKACSIASSRCECVLARESAFCPTHEQAQYARMFPRRKAKKPQQRKQTFAQRLATASSSKKTVKADRFCPAVQQTLFQVVGKPAAPCQKIAPAAPCQKIAPAAESALQPPPCRPAPQPPPCRPAPEPSRPVSTKQPFQKNSKLVEPCACSQPRSMPPVRVKPKKVIPAPAGVPLINTLFARAALAPAPTQAAAPPPGACVGNKVWRKPPPSLWTEAYDPSKHGFWMVKGQLMYIYADGRRQLAGAVNGVGADGRLIPEKPL